MKRFFWMTLLVLVFASACRTGPVSRVDSPNEDLTVIGMCQVGAESDWRVANSESMKAVFTEANGYRLLFDDARQKQENQITAIRKFIQQQVDCILLMPLCVTGWDSVLQEAKAAGIPVILVDRTIEVLSQMEGVTKILRDIDFGGGEDVTTMMRDVQEHGGQVIELVFGMPLSAPHHNDYFDVDEEVIPLAIRIFTQLALTAGDWTK